MCSFLVQSEICSFQVGNSRKPTLAARNWQQSSLDFLQLTEIFAVYMFREVRLISETGAYTTVYKTTRAYTQNQQNNTKYQN